MLADAEILVAVERGEHHGAVLREADGELCVAHWVDPERVGATRLQGTMPGRIGGNGWWLVGGRMPAGAVSATVRGLGNRRRDAAVANGAFAIFVPGDVEAPGPPPAVRFADAAGELVSRASEIAADGGQPLDPAMIELLASGQHEAGGACRACGTTDWRTAPVPAERGSGVVIFCGRCGHGDGASYGFFGPGAEGPANPMPYAPLGPPPRLGPPHVPDPADLGPPIIVRLDALLLGDLGNTRVDARLLNAILLRDGIVARWLRDRGVDLPDVDDAFPGCGWD